MPRLTFLLVVATAIGCTDPAAPTNTLIYGRGGDADTLDPIHTSLGETVKVLVNIYDTLVTYDDVSIELVPSLATRWETSDDGLIWTFYLREGVQFHDGTPFTAAAVVFTFERILDDDHPHVYGPLPAYRPHYAMIRRVESVDDLTVKFTLDHPSAVFLNNLGMFPAGIVSPAAVQQQEKTYGSNPVGTGPFQLEAWARGEELVLMANDAHWRGRPVIDRAIFIPVAESAIRVQQLKRAEVHIADNLPPPEIDALVGEPEIVIQQHNGMNIGYLTMQMEKPPLDNVKVRYAIWHAIDKRRLCAVAYADHAIPAENMTPPTIWGHLDEIQGRREFDPSTSRRLLEEASREDGFSLPLSLTLFAMASPRPYMQQPRQTAVFIKDALSDVGIDVRIETGDIRQYFRRLSAGEHELGLSGWSSDTADPDSFLFSLLHASQISDAGGSNMSRYRNAAVDTLLEQAQQEPDQSRRAEMYRAAQQLIYDDAPTVPLVHTKVRIAQRSELKGYLLHPSSMVRLRRAYFEVGQ